MSTNVLQVVQCELEKILAFQEMWSLNAFCVKALFCWLCGEFWKCDFGFDQCMLAIEKLWLFDAIKPGWNAMSDSWALLAIEQVDVWAGTRYRDSPAGSLLRRLQMMSKAQDRSACIRYILPSFLGGSDVFHLCSCQWNVCFFWGPYLNNWRCSSSWEDSLKH